MATAAKETLHLTAAEWQRRCDEDGCEPVPEDVLLKALGPAACAQTSSRFHLHFGAGRLGLGLVVPAVSASGVPFAVVQRPKVRWQQLFRHGARPDQCRVSVNSEVLVQNVDVLAARGGGIIFGMSLFARQNQWKAKVAALAAVEDQIFHNGIPTILFGHA